LYLLLLFSITFVPYTFLFFFYCFGDHRDLHSFPTRRSSDLVQRFDEHQRAAAGHRQQDADAKHETVKHGQQHDEPVQGDGFQHRSEEHTSELQSRFDLVCRLLLEKKKKKKSNETIDTKKEDQ